MKTKFTLPENLHYGWRELPQPQGVKVIDWHSEFRTVRTRETDKAVIRDIEEDHWIKMKPGGWEYVWTQKHTEREQKFLCVGGPLTHRMRTEKEAGDSYERYNCASRGGPGLLVHEDSVVFKKFNPDCLHCEGSGELISRDDDQSPDCWCWGEYSV